MADVSVVYNKAGDAFVGFEHEGAFVSFATVSASNIASAVERAKSLAELAASDDPEAKARHDFAAEGRPYSSKGHAEKPTAKNAKGGES